MTVDSVRSPVVPAGGRVNDAHDLEDEIASRRHAPRSVEQYGVEPVPRSQRTTGFWDLFGIQLSFQINNLTITLPALGVAAGLNVFAAVFAQALGVALLFIGYVLLATYGQRYGIPRQVGTRAAFGTIGSRIFASLLRAVSSAYWFAWQTLAAALGLQVIIEAWTGTRLSLVGISLVFAVFQAGIALTGWESLRYLTRVVLPIKVLILAFVIIVFLTSSRPAFAWDNISSGGSWTWALIAVWAGIAASGHLSMYTDAADLSRHARSAGEVRWAFWSAAVISTLFCGVIGAIAAKAVGDTNWFEAAAGVQPHWWMFLLLLIVLVADNWFINVMNLYTGGFAIVNIFAGLGRFWATVICATAGVTLSAFTGVYENTPQIITEIGFAFAPVGGILLGHYVLLGRMKLDMPALFAGVRGRYWYLGGMNPIAVAVAVAGFFTARSDLISESLLRPLLVVVVAAGLYSVLMLVASRFWPAARHAVAHEELDTDYDAVAVSRRLLEKNEMLA
jgi:NCS1 family nucleobase:cation symporter-1